MFRKMGLELALSHFQIPNTFYFPFYKPLLTTESTAVPLCCNGDVPTVK